VQSSSQIITTNKPTPPTLGLDFDGDQDHDADPGILSLLDWDRGICMNFAANSNKSCRQIVMKHFGGMECLISNKPVEFGAN